MMKNTMNYWRQVGFLLWILVGGAGLGLSFASFVDYGDGWFPLIASIPFIIIGIFNSLPSKAERVAIRTLQGCGLSGKYYNAIDKAAEGARDIIQSLRNEISGPSVDLQKLVLRKLKVEGYTTGGDSPEYSLLPINERLKFSERKQIADQVEKWCVDLKCPTSPFNVVTAIDDLRLMRKSSK